MDEGGDEVVSEEDSKADSTDRICPSSKCWTYDAISATCQMKQSLECATLQCSALKMFVQFDEKLFAAKRKRFQIYF